VCALRRWALALRWRRRHARAVQARAHCPSLGHPITRPSPLPAHCVTPRYVIPAPPMATQQFFAASACNDGDFSYSPARRPRLTTAADSTAGRRRLRCSVDGTAVGEGVGGGRA